MNILKKLNRYFKKNTPFISKCQKFRVFKRTVLMKFLHLMIFTGTLKIKVVATKKLNRVCIHNLHRQVSAKMQNNQLNWRISFLPVVLFAFATALTSTNYANAQLKKTDWLFGHNGDLTVETLQNSYPNKVGFVEISWNQPGRESLNFQVVETDPSGNEASTKDTHDFDGDFPADNDVIPDSDYGGIFKGNDHLIDKNFQYGMWYFSQKYSDQGHSCSSTICRAVLFKPNSQNINMLNLGQTVTSEFISRHYEGSRLVTTKKLVVTIRRLGPLITIEPIVTRKYVVLDDSENQVRLRLSSIPENPVTVQYQISTTHSFDPMSGVVIDRSIDAGQADANGEVTLEHLLNIVDDRITGNTEHFRNTISIRLLDSDGDTGPNGYRIPSGNIGNNLSMTIVDSTRLPSVRVGRLFSQTASIDETQNEIRFVFRANHPTPIKEDIVVHYEVTQTGDFTSPAKIGKFTAKIPKTNSIEAYLELPLPIINDEYYEPDGAVTVTVLADQSTGTPKYKVQEHQNSPPYFSPTASVSVRSEDAKPVVSIAPPTGGSIKEGDDDGGFMVTATGQWSNEFTVDFTLTEQGGTQNFIETGSPTTLTFPPNTTADSLTRPFNPIHIDSTVEAGTGSITATLASVIDDDHYTLGTPVSATATAEGNDPGVSLSWADGESGEITDLGLDSYGTISGNSLVAIPANGTFDLEVSARESGMAGSAPDIGSSSSSVSGFSSEVSTTYGKWQWKDDDSGFRFDPDADAINRLGDEVVTTTLFVRIVDASTRSEEHIGSIDLTISGTRDLELSISAGGAVTEADGAVAVFTVTSDVKPSDAIDVDYTPVATGNFLLAPDAANPSIKGHISGTMTSAVMEFSDRSPNADGSGPFTYRLSIPLRDNSDTDTGVQSVTVTLNPDADGRDYSVSASNSSASVTIVDDESLPVLTLEENGNPAEFYEADASGAVTFKVTASSIPTDVYPDSSDVEIDVRYTISQTGDFINTANGIVPNSPTTTKLTFAENNGIATADISIPIAADELVEPDGSVEITLLDAGTLLHYYKLGSDAERNSHEVKIFDSKDPELSVSIDNTEFTEGEAMSVQFTVSAKFNVRGSLSVNLTVWESDSATPDTESGAKLFVGPVSSPVTLNFNGTNQQSLDIPIENDEMTEGTARYVNVRLDLGTGYAVSDDGGSSRILVLDDDGTAIVPTLSISGPTGTITEANGAVANFTVTSDLDPGAEAIEVRYTVTATGGILLPPDPAPPASRTNNGHISGEMESVMMAFANGGTGTRPFTYRLEIPLRDNEAPDEKAHTVTVTLNDDTNGADYQVSNDSSARILVADESGVALPFANVTSAREYYTEGEDLVFNISMSPDQSGVVQVSLLVSQRGDFIPGRVGKSIRVSGSGAVLQIPTVDDHAVEDEGRVTVQVLDGEEYQPGPNGSATAKIRDNDSLNATPGPRYSVVSSVITEILQAIPPTPPQGESRDAKPTLSIRAVKGTVNEGELAVFAISASHAVNPGIPVQIKLSQTGDFIVGPMDRTVNLQTDLSETEFAVATDNDGLAEADGRITATIQSGSEYLVSSQNTAHVTVSDALDRKHRKTSVATALNAVLPDLLAHSTARTLAIANNRIAQGFSGSPSTSIELNGKSPAMTALQSGGEMLNGNNTDWKSLIDGSSFTVALYPEGSETSPATVWGAGDKWNLSNRGNGGQQSWDGETYSGHFGFDAAVGPGMLAGLAMSVSQSEIGYGQNGDSGMSFNTMATGLHPYLGISTSDGNSRMQIVAGYGENELELQQKEYSPEILSANYNMVAIGGSRNVYSIDSFRGLSNLELSITGGAWHSRQFVDSLDGVTDSLHLEASHVRIAIDESHDHHFGNIGTLSPSLSIGLRGDGRNEKSIFGLNVGSGIRYDAFDGIEVLGSGKSLLAGLIRVHRWEIESSLDYDSGSDGKGVLFNVSQSWSGTDANTERYIWGSELAGASNDSIGSLDGASMEIEFGYGFEVLYNSALITPYSVFNQTKSHGSEFQIGSRFATLTGIDFELDAVRKIPESGAVGHEVNLTVNIIW